MGELKSYVSSVCSAHCVHCLVGADVGSVHDAALPLTNSFCACAAQITNISPREGDKITEYYVGTLCMEPDDPPPGCGQAPGRRIPLLLAA